MPPPCPAPTRCCSATVPHRNDWTQAGIPMVSLHRHQGLSTDPCPSRTLTGGLPPLAAPWGSQKHAQRSHVALGACHMLDAGGHCAACGEASWQATPMLQHMACKDPHMDLPHLWQAPQDFLCPQYTPRMHSTHDMCPSRSKLRSNL